MSKPLTRDELRDFFWDAILGSIDMDWSATTGAEAIMREVDKLGATDKLCEALAAWGETTGAASCL